RDAQVRRAADDHIAPPHFLDELRRRHSAVSNPREELRELIEVLDRAMRREQDASVPVHRAEYLRLWRGSIPNREAERRPTRPGALERQTAGGAPRAAESRAEQRARGGRGAAGLTGGAGRPRPPRPQRGSAAAPGA